MRQREGGGGQGRPDGIWTWRRKLQTGGLTLGKTKRSLGSSRYGLLDEGGVSPGSQGKGRASNKGAQAKATQSVCLSVWPASRYDAISPLCQRECSHDFCIKKGCRFVAREQPAYSIPYVSVCLA